MHRLILLAVLAFASGSCVFYLNPLCSDEILNGEETDVDCGGSCGPCKIGGSCDKNGDCDNDYCVGGTCTPLPCVNGVKDMAETDVDCGGGTCRKCAGKRQCGGDGDCFSGKCEAGKCSALQTITFAEPVYYPSGDKTYVLFSGDFNGDKAIDLVAANEQGNSVTMFLNRGDGSFITGPMYMTGEYPTGGTVADFNHDGHLDVITADSHGDSVSILYGRGDGTLAPALIYPASDGAVSNLAVGDLDGNGALDVVAAQFEDGAMSLYLGRPDGTLQTSSSLAIPLPGRDRPAFPFSAAIVDFNGDGKNDLAIGEGTSFSMAVRMGNGDGTFGEQVLYNGGGTPPFIIMGTDINRDGKMDIVSANRGSSDVTVLLGRGDGRFEDALVSTTGKDTGPYAIAIADMNQDGVPDVVTPNFVSNTASVLLGIGDGRFEAPISIPRTGVTTYGVVAADLNADGKVDVAVCSATSNDVAVMLSTAQ